MVGGVAPQGYPTLPKRAISGDLEKAESGGKKKERAHSVAEDRRVFGITGDWSTNALDPGTWHNTVWQAVPYL